MRIIICYLLMALAFSVASNTQAQVIRVMSYNIHHANPPSKPGEIDLNAVVEVIKAQDPDLVALQEVDVHTQRSGNVDQAKAIAEKSDMYFYFGKAIDYQNGEYGVAILSKYPIEHPKVYPLPSHADPEAEPRVLAVATIRLPNGKTLLFGSTHLDVRSAGNRKLQIKRIIELASGESHPFLLAGDLNATPESAVIKKLDKHFTRSCDPCGFTIPVEVPDRTIDYVAFFGKSSFRIIDHKVIPERYASDHLPIVADFEFQSE